MKTLILYAPLIIIVGANVLYHVTAKAMPPEASTFASLTVTYFFSMLMSIILFFVTSPEKNLAAAASGFNWPSVLMSLALIGMETGTILMFKVGWDMSIGPLVAHIALCVTLIFVGVFAYHEHLSVIQTVGIVLCLVGVILANKK